MLQQRGQCRCNRQNEISWHQLKAEHCQCMMSRPHYTSCFCVELFIFWTLKSCGLTDTHLILHDLQYTATDTCTKSWLVVEMASFYLSPAFTASSAWLYTQWRVNRPPLKPVWATVSGTAACLSIWHWGNDYGVIVGLLTVQAHGLYSFVQAIICTGGRFRNGYGNGDTKNLVGISNSNAHRKAL